MEKWIKIHDTSALYDTIERMVTRGVRDGVTVYIYRLDKNSGTWVQQRKVSINTLRSGIRRGTHKFM